MSLTKAQKKTILKSDIIHNPLLNGYEARTLTALANKGIMKAINFGYSQVFRLTEKGEETKKRLQNGK